MKHGFLLVDKPLGYTSHDVVAVVRKELNERKIGHLGTLDPNASGLLVLAVGKKALKVLELFEKASKKYTAHITFGTTSTTYDADGVLEDITPPVGFTEPTRSEVERMIADQFTGDISQVPPAHSAVHIEGKRAYELARSGALVDMPVRQVIISSFTIQQFEYPEFVATIECSSGTYIRSLAHDLGQKFRCGAYLSALRRTHVGPWSVDFAVPLESIGWSYIMPLKEVLDSMPGMSITKDQLQALQFGQTISGTLPVHNTVAWNNGLPVALLENKKDKPGAIKARKVL